MNQHFSTFGLPHDLLKAIRDYQSLEQKVSQLVVSVCRPFCSTCSNCCCKTDFCSEAFDSYWLEMTWKLWGYNRSQYDDSIGWLLSDGCRLAAGRPPVCYEYLCNKIIDGIPNDTLYHLKEVSMQLSSAGKKALGNRHLITLTSEQIMTRMNIRKLRRQITNSLHLVQKYEEEMSTF